MGVSKKELVELHPQLFHMAEEGSWPSIRDNGLMSTTALLDHFEVNGQERIDIEERNRRTAKRITHPFRGSVVIRDQIPMTDTALDKCLVGLSRPEWYRLLNARVFFWSREDRLLGLLNARAYRGKTQCIITIDTARFLERYADRIELSPINSGSTIYAPQRRGRDTFLPLSAFPYEDWKKKRTRSKAIVEVTVNHSVPDITDFVTDVVHMTNGLVVERIV